MVVVWNFFVIHYLTKWIYNFLLLNSDIPAAYISRKIIHVFGGGITAILILIFYEGYYWLVAGLAFILALYLLFRRYYKPLYWFRIKENNYEIHFVFAYGILLIIGVLLNNLLVGLIPIFFMSFGDAATGLIRAATQKRHVKSWEGSAAMLIICSIIGYIFLGLYGIIVGAVATLAEKIPGIDDNITIPLVTGLLVYLAPFI
jgi:dolichol kinase